MKTKSENRRALPKFLIILFISGIVGGVLGFVTSFFGFFAAPEAALAINRFLKEASFYGIPASAVVLLGAGWLLYFRAKSRFNAWDGEDEAAAEGVERTLDWCLLWSAVYQVLDLFLFGAGCIYYKDDQQSMRMLWVVGFFLLTMAVNIVLQQKVVDLTKRMNPEKRGSVYDMKFQKKWMDSCDEAEQRQIGQACYTAYRVTGNLCIGLWLALMLLAYVYDIGILPLFSVMLIWGVMQVSYVLASMKLERRGTPKKENVDAD